MTGVSVVVPTRGRIPLLTRLVSGLYEAASALDGSCPVEFIFVDDTPNPEAKTVRALCAREGVRYLPGPRGVGAKRNAGAAAANYDLLVFTDSDCVPQRSFLTAHVERPPGKEPPDLGAVAGLTVLEGKAKTWAWLVAEESEVFAPPPWGFPRVDSVVAPWLWAARFSEVPWAPTSNLSVSKRAFEAVGGFDENPFTVVGGEDVDFCARLRQAGYRIGCTPEAVVLHAREPQETLRGMIRKEFLYGRSCVYNCARHPSETIARANPVAIAGALLTAAIARRSPRILAVTGLILSAWWLNDSWHHPQGRKLSWRRLLAVSLEWAFQAGIVTEAIRQGTPLQALRRYNYFAPEHFIDTSDRANSAYEQAESRR
jgi:GT2 family glycosyltransferase